MTLPVIPFRYQRILLVGTMSALGVALADRLN